MFFTESLRLLWWFSIKDSAHAGDSGWIPGLERSLGEGNGSSLQHSCLGNPMDRGAWQATVHGILQARIMEWVTFPSPGHLPNPGTKPRSPTLQAHSLPAEPQRKPKNTGVDSLSLLQWIFLTQELNRGLLHCRWILYQLSYDGSLQSKLLLSNSLVMWFTCTFL